MPFYEYECANCGHELEAMQKISDPPLRKCPECGKSTLKKLMSSPVFRLKGSGWYETDFKSDKEGKRNLADAPDKDEKKEEKKEDKKEDKTGEVKVETRKEDSKSETATETKTASTPQPAIPAASSGKASKRPARAPKRTARRSK